MSLTQKRVYLLKEVFSKVKYDTITKNFYIPYEDYIFLNLDSSQLILLKNMCNENDIHLETAKPSIKSIKIKKLYEEYRLIERKLKRTTNTQEKENLEESIKELQKEIVNTYIKQVYCLIERKMPNLKRIKEPKEIYQICSETLTEFYDKYKPNKEEVFLYFIKEYLIYHIIRKIFTNTNIRYEDTIYLLSKIREATQSLEEKNKNQTINNLSKESQIKKEKIKEILQIKSLTKILKSSFEERNPKTRKL